MPTIGRPSTARTFHVRSLGAIHQQLCTRPDGDVRFFRALRSFCSFPVPSVRFHKPTCQSISVSKNRPPVRPEPSQEHLRWHCAARLQARSVQLAVVVAATAGTGRPPQPIRQGLRGSSARPRIATGSVHQGLVHALASIATPAQRPPTAG